MFSLPLCIGDRPQPVIVTLPGFFHFLSQEEVKHSVKKFTVEYLQRFQERQPLVGVSPMFSQASDVHTVFVFGS